MSFSPALGRTDPSIPTHYNIEQREENEGIIDSRTKCRKVAKFLCFLTIPLAAAVSLATRVGPCKDLSSEECTDEYEYLTPLEVTGSIAASVLLGQKVTECILGCSLNDCCTATDEQIS